MKGRKEYWGNVIKKNFEISDLDFLFILILINNYCVFLVGEKKS